MRGTNGLPATLQLKLLRSILEFMSRSGSSDSAIRRSLTSCLSNLGSDRIATSVSTSRDCKYVGNGNVSAELIRMWTRDGRYIDRDARPKALLLSTGRCSLVSLISRLDPAVDPHAIVNSMMAVGLIRKLRNGRYLPTADSVKIDRLHPLAVEHAAKSLIRMVSTVYRNTDTSRQAVPLIERYAYVPDMSKAEAEAFADFTRSQGMAYLEAVDDWMERRRVGRISVKSGRTEQAGIAAGVHLVAYLGDGLIKSPSRRLEGGRAGKLRKRPTPAREARV
jgi:Family of unknown function (DUF6502)